MAAGVKSFSKTFVWIILALLVVGLAGFGATNLSGTIRTVAQVGDETVGVQQLGRELQREIRAFEAQTGESLQISQARALGLDRRALNRLITLAAIDNEVAQLGLSIGDENLQKEIVAIQAFQGIDGKFDRESYRFTLEQSGIDEAEFEADLRREAARTLVQSAIVAGVEMPPVMTETMVNFIGERRNFTVARVDASTLEGDLPAPTEEELKAYYDANIEDFTLPETKVVSYALLSPDMILDQVEVDDDAVQKLYDSRLDEYQVPERRLVERLVFSDEESAASAKAQLDVGGASFESLVEGRGLTMSDVDLGDMTRDALGDAADAVFAAEIGDVLGPLPSSLGPALFRVNGQLAERTTDFDSAAPDLRDELAGDRARRLIETQAEGLNDLLAGGATLEELADESDMEIGKLDWTTASSDGPAAYDAFRQAATQATPEDYPEVTFLDDGGIFALRVDEVLPPRPQPFEEARAGVTRAWELQETQTRLEENAEQFVQQLSENGDFTETGLPFRVENGLTRTAFLDGTPPDFMNQVFAMQKGELKIVSGAGTVQIVRLEDILPPEQTDELGQLSTAITEQMDQAVAQALFDALARDAQIRAHPVVDQQAVNALLAGFQ